MNDTKVMLVEDVAEILKLAKNTIHSRRWQERSGCPLFRRGKRLYVTAPDFWKWFKKGK